MTWTFDDSLSTDRDKVRANIGDTDTNDQQFSDEQIAAVLAIQTDVNMASAALCDQLAAKYARKVSGGALGATRAASDLFEHYRELAKTLRRLGPGDVVGGGGTRVGGILVGGIKRSEFEAEAEDDTYRKPSFSIGMDEHTGSSAYDGDWD